MSTATSPAVVTATGNKFKNGWGVFFNGTLPTRLPLGDGSYGSAWVVSDEIKVNPELLEMLAIKGAIMSIDAMGTQKASPQRSPRKSTVTFGAQG